MEAMKLQRLRTFIILGCKRINQPTVVLVIFFIHFFSLFTADALGPPSQTVPNQQEKTLGQVDTLLSQGHNWQTAREILSFLKELPEKERHLVLDQRMDALVNYYHTAEDYSMLDQLGDLVFWGDRPSKAICMILKRALQLEQQTFANENDSKVLEKQREINEEINNIMGEQGEPFPDLFPFQEEVAREVASAMVRWLTSKDIHRNMYELYKGSEIPMLALKYIEHLLPEQRKVWYDPVSSNTARIFVEALTQLSPHGDSRSQNREVIFFLNQMAKDPESTTPLAFYLLALFQTQGCLISDNDTTLYAIADLANSISGESNLFPVRLVLREIFHHLSGEVLAGPDEDIRVLTRVGTYGSGLLGTLRDEIHNHLSKANVVLLERTLLYWKDGDPEVLFDPSFHRDTFPSTEKIRGMTVFSRESVQEVSPLAESDPHRKWLNLLDEKLPEEYGKSFLERLRNVPDEELFEVYRRLADEYPDSKGWVLNRADSDEMKIGAMTVPAYVYTYRELTRRFHRAGERHLGEELASRINELYWQLEFQGQFGYFFGESRLLSGSDHWEGHIGEVVDEMIWIQQRLRELILSREYYDPKAVRDWFTYEYGRDDTGNAVGGARIHDKKFIAFQIDHLMGQFEAILRTKVNDYLWQKGSFSDREQRALFKKLAMLSYETGFAGLSLVDHAHYWLQGDLSYAEAYDVGLMISEDLQDLSRYLSTRLSVVLGNIYGHFPKEEVLRNDGSLGLEEEGKELKQPDSANRKQGMIYLLNKRLQSKYELPVLLLHYYDKLTEDIRVMVAEGVKTANRHYVAGDRSLLKKQIRSCYGIWPGMSKEELREILAFGRKEWGSKQIGLLRAMELDIPVPPAIIIPARWTSDPRIVDEVIEYFQKNQERLNSTPLGLNLYAVRSGNYIVMPGQARTITNVGFSDAFIKKSRIILKALGLTESEVDWVIADIQRRFLEDFAVEVIQKFTHHDFDRIIDQAKGERAKEQLSGREMQRIADQYLMKILKAGVVVPDDVEEQLSRSIKVVMSSWELTKSYRMAKGFHGDWNESGLMIQSMVFGNLRRNSGSGVLFTRDPNNWNKRMVGDYKWYAQGRDIADSLTRPIPLETLHNERMMIPLRHYAYLLEQMNRTSQEIEYVIEDGRVWIIQVRDVPYPEKHPFFKEPLPEERILIRKGEAVPATGGGFRGVVVYSEQLHNRRMMATIRKQVQREKEKNLEKRSLDGILLVSDELLPRDVPLLNQRGVKAVVTRQGGVGSHSADIAREFNWVGVTGAATLRWNSKAEKWQTPLGEILPRSVISIDGRTGEVARGSFPIVARMDQVNNNVLEERDHASEDGFQTVERAL